MRKEQKELFTLPLHLNVEPQTAWPSVCFHTQGVKNKVDENGHLINVIPIQERFCPRKGLKCPYDLLLLKLKLIPCFETKYYAKLYLLRSVVESRV